MSRFGRTGHLVYLAVFVLAGLYASLLLLATINGLHSEQNSLIFGCGVFFIARAIFASRAALLRKRALEETPPSALPWHASDTVFTIGDIAAVGSLALTAWVFATNQDRMGAPLAPFGIGLAIAYPFYLAATLQRLRRPWAET